MLELLDGLEYTCPKMYMDNYYTSPELFLTLYSKRVNACGTARANRKFYPTDLKLDKSVSVGYYDFQSITSLCMYGRMNELFISFLPFM